MAADDRRQSDAATQRLTWDDNVAEAISVGGSFLFPARLGWRGEIRQVLRALAYEQGRRISITSPWPDLLDEDESPHDWFYCLVTA